MRPWSAGALGGLVGSVVLVGGVVATALLRDPPKTGADQGEGIILFLVLATAWAAAGVTSTRLLRRGLSLPTAVLLSLGVTLLPVVVLAVLG